MKTTTFFKLALLVTLVFGTVNLTAQGNKRGNSGKGNANAYGQSKVKNQGNANAYGQSKTKNQGNANAYGQSKVKNQGNANAYGQSKERNQGNAGRTNQGNIKHQNNQRTVVNHNTTVVNRNSKRVVQPTHTKMASHQAVRKTYRGQNSVRHIDKSYTSYHHSGYDYSYRNGYYYTHRNGLYVSIAPPIGLRISLMPRGYHRVMVRNIPYYYFGGVFYSYVGRDYEVVQPPVGAIVPELPEYDVAEVTINGELYYEYDNILYKPVVTSNGVAYRVVGNMAM